MTEALASAGPPGLQQDEIESLVGDPSTLSTHRIWIPDLTGLDDPQA